jgi:hypothetical protein
MGRCSIRVHRRFLIYFIPATKLQSKAFAAPGVFVFLRVPSWIYSLQ